MKRASAATALIVAVTLFSGGMLHASVQHEHGNHSHAEESPQWSAFHSALRHEDDKALLLLVLIVIGATVLAPRRFSLPLTMLAVPVERAEYLLEELRRGVALYRRFG